MSTRNLFPLILSAIAALGVVMLTFDPDPLLAAVGTFVLTGLFFPFFKGLFKIASHNGFNKEESLPAR